MKIEELMTEEAIGLPVAYEMFTQKTHPPFCVYVENEQNNICADDMIYTTIKNYEIELYTMYRRERDIEKRLEEYLISKEVIYEKMIIGYIESEKMFEVVYSISLLESEESK